MKKLIIVLFAVLLFSCNKDDDPKPEIVLNVTNSSIELTHDQAQNIGATTNSGNNINYIVEDEHIATVENGKVTGVLIGETKITVTDNVNSKTVNVSTVAKSNIFTTPYLGFGESQTQVKKRFENEETREFNDSSGFYVNKGDYAHAYLFENGKLISSAIYFKNSDYTATELSNYLYERYYYKSKDDSIFNFTDRNNDYFIYLNIKEDASFIIFID